MGYRALLVVPLLREDQVMGALAVNRRTPGEFAPEVVELLKTFEPATFALENLALRHQLLVLRRSVRRPSLAQRDRVLFSEADGQEQSSLVVSPPCLSSSFGR